MCFYPIAGRLQRIGMLVLIPLLVACASTAKSPDELSPAEGQIYRISETEALALARQALRRAFPDTDIATFEGAFPGYFTFVQHPTDTDVRYARFVAETVTYTVEVIPVQGRDGQGRQIDGYLYRLKGGAKGKADAQAQRLRAQLAELFDATGRGLPATQLTALHKTKAEREAQRPREAQPSEPSTVPVNPGADVYEALRQLKRLHDEGVLSDEEYQKSKNRLLERL